MKKLAFVFLFFILILSGCASKTVTKQDRNEILIDDLYKINKTLTQRVTDLESQLKYLSKGGSNAGSNNVRNRKAAFRVKGKTHELDESIYYGKPANSSKSKPQSLSKTVDKKPKKKSYSQLAKELDAKIAAEKNQNKPEKKPTDASNSKTSTTRLKTEKTASLPPKQEKPSSEINSKQFSPIEKFTASTFRTTNNVQLIDEQNQPMETWVSGTSFTSKEKWGDYYKVSGYFINKQWTRAENTLLLPIDQVIQR